MREKILLMNDLPGFGKVALAAAMPILSHYGYSVYNLPTAIVSNTLDYGRFNIQENTQYMKKTVQVWDELGFSVDAISTGFLASKEQQVFVRDYCRQQADKGVKIFVDPIMGDHGRLYNGVSKETVDHMRELCKTADYIVPNFTEAAFLAGIFQDKSRIGEDELEILIQRLRRLGAKSVIITSIPIDGKTAVGGYDDVCQRMFLIPFEEIPARFPGTGDIFSAIMVAGVMEGKPLKESVESAVQIISRLLKEHEQEVEKYKGIPFETCMEVFDE